MPLDAALLGPLLAGCPRLAELRLGGVRFTRPPVPAKPEALPPLSHAARPDPRPPPPISAT